ncbi:MAG: NAD-dependent epimerase/dehydratase family protein [Cyanobacteria bacterium SIG31]|nr:NAD-dependent epimerase/dehydratase family protein [Cyanobacteria bacterium SIG31]
MVKFKHNIERLDTREIIKSKYLNWDCFKNKTVLVTGATGLIGTQIVKALLYANEYFNTNINIIALVRNKEKAKKIFTDSAKIKCLKFIHQDIIEPIKYNKNVDYIIHTANSTSSASFVKEPVETIDSILQGTKNVLNFARKSKAKSIVYLSSMEVYGEIPLTRIEPLSESDLGYVDILKPRSSYQEGKRAAECLCSAYANKYDIPVKIARLAQTIGACVDYNDNRVFTQFARSIAEGKDITLKTKGETIRSYCYITDAVVAIFSLLEKGQNGEAYNIANPDTTCSIREMAELLCNKHPKSKLIIREENDTSYLNTLKYYLDISKISSQTNWSPQISLEEAFNRLINSLSYQQCIFKDNNKQKKFINRIFNLRNNGKYKLLTICNCTIKIDKAIWNKLLCSNSKIKNNLIVMNNFGGKDYGCNPKYIAEEILRRKLPYDILWLCEDKKQIDKKLFPQNIKLTGYKDIEGIKALSSAKIIVSNVHCNPLIASGWTKKQNQVYIQTWHGSLGIKKIDFSVKNNDSVFFTKTWEELTKIDIENIDYLITNSEFEKNVFSEGLLWNNDFTNIGHPRNDIFFKDNETLDKIKEKVFSTLGIDSTKKVLFYAPSYRDDKHIDVYNLDYDMIIKSLKEKFGGDWILVIRLHPHHANIKNKSAFYKNNKNVIDASRYPDIQELLIAADVGITDYSSWIFDFMLSKKPAFIYAEDIEKYNTDRGFYYPLETTPFPVARTTTELINKISNFDINKYKIDVEKFLQDKGCIENGQASKKLVDLIEDIMNE